MNYRRLGRTGLEVSEVGYGAWGISGSQWLGAEDEESLRALNRAIDLGVTFIDTALAYGDGHSERLVGSVVRERPERVVVATKVPPKNLIWPAPPGVDPDEVFPAEHVVACTERSLRNLGVDAIDVLQFHVWHDEWVGRGTWLEAIERLRADGRVRAFGVSINDHQPENAMRLIESGVVDTVQVIYNIFDQSPADQLFPYCRECDVGVIVRVPFDEGALTGSVRPDTTFPDGDFRNHYFEGDRKQQVWDRVQAICAELDADLDDLPEIALRFTLSDPAVSTVIPGMRSVRNVERNTAAGDGRGLRREQVERLRAHSWARDYYH
ncbi:MAG TPA: aldo/keto reductase [Thermoleophilaceae bacterium]|jgi:aryl-alcohol dehydrogenase-like predicted oxidoreductase